LRYINPHRSSQYALAALYGIYEKTQKTIYNAYMHHTYMRDVSVITAGHRFVIFLGNDMIWYVLDPTLTHRRSPMPLVTYLSQHTKKSGGDKLYIDPLGYVPGEHIMQAEEGLYTVRDFDDWQNIYKR
jgi:hypothetical protein